MVIEVVIIEPRLENKEYISNIHILVNKNNEMWWVPNSYFNSEERCISHGKSLDYVIEESSKFGLPLIIKSEYKINHRFLKEEYERALSYSE